jgi:hypothetical protein
MRPSLKSSTLREYMASVLQYRSLSPEAPRMFLFHVWHPEGIISTYIVGK